MSEAINLRLEGFVALLVGWGVSQIASEVAAEPVGHVPHEWASGAGMIDLAEEGSCEVREDADHDATVSEGDKLGMIHDGLPTLIRQCGLNPISPASRSAAETAGCGVVHLMVAFFDRSVAPVISR
ncbi:hypothetical protein [Curtobacterium sp. PhB136]|uniref:hypothetical protein n=1 Tax=Curtobacterium sp. PhB136 TaxID=2485181 RepID=UPI00104C0BB5|nr:hypothetical protein [Curtobacterium sp. PhB136]